jgi:hypothetical protein
VAADSSTVGEGKPTADEVVDSSTVNEGKTTADEDRLIVDEDKLIVGADKLIVGVDEATVDKVTEADILVEGREVKVGPVLLYLSILVEANVDHFEEAKEEDEEAVVEVLRSTSERDSTSLYL